MSETELEQLLRESLEDDTKIGEFYAKLLSSELYVLTDGSNAIEGSRVLEREEEILLINFPMEDGTPYIPIFTSLHELESSIQEDIGYIQMSGWDLFSMIQESDAVINPASEFGIHFTSSIIKDLLQDFKQDAVVVEEGSAFFLTKPDFDTTNLKNALCEVFKKDSRVQSAYMGFAVWQNVKEPPSVVVGIIFFPDQEYPEIFQIAGPPANRFLPQGYNLDFIVIDSGADGGMAAALLEEGECFYRIKSQA